MKTSVESGAFDLGFRRPLEAALVVCVCQLDLAPFDALIWPHLVLVSVCAGRRPRGTSTWPVVDPAQVLLLAVHLDLVKQLSFPAARCCVCHLGNVFLCYSQLSFNCLRFACPISL